VCVCVCVCVCVTLGVAATSETAEGSQVDCLRETPQRNH